MRDESQIEGWNRSQTYWPYTRRRILGQLRAEAKNINAFRRVLYSIMQ
jgi:hypothetical protein